jgi:aspartyl protease family protein
LSDGVGDGADKALTFLYFIGLLVLVGSALAARRLPWGQTAKMAAAWALIFAAAFVGFSLKDEFLALGRHVAAKSRGEGIAVAGGKALRIGRREDGHFWVAARVNGEAIDFLIDSGAAVTSLTAADAQRARVALGGGPPVPVETANGTVMADTATLDALEVGPIRRTQWPVHVAAAFGRTNVLGMDFLSSLAGWGVEGGTLVLRP